MGRQVASNRPEARRSTHGQDEAHVTVRGGPNGLTLKSYPMSCGSE
jgi:hypothetical protein